MDLAHIGALIDLFPEGKSSFEITPSPSSFLFMSEDYLDFEFYSRQFDDSSPTEI